MGSVIQFRRERTARPFAGDGRSQPSDAVILLFTGIRRERYDDPGDDGDRSIFDDEPDGPWPRGRRRRR